MSVKGKVLVLGSSGAMGKHLVPLLAEQGWQVDAVSLDGAGPEHPNVNRIKGEVVQDKALVSELQSRTYDGIINFISYSSPWLLDMLEWTRNCGHYFFLSSYRVYADKEHPVKETSPRLLDTGDDVLLCNTDDYCIYKARGENILPTLERKNWTIVRPSITYALMRYQLVTLEAANTVGRAFAGKPVPLPAQAKDVPGTMTWAGDQARFFAGLLGKPEAMGETYSFTTAEHHTWGEIAEYYREICGLKAVWIDAEEYLDMIATSPKRKLLLRWQLEYDRLFDRTMDNTKVLAATGRKQSDLMPLYKGLEYEIGRCPKDYAWPVNEAIDRFLASKGIQ